jgi:hypothetical protein
MNDWLGSRWMKEMNSIKNMVEIIKYYIETKEKIKEELILEQEDFFVEKVGNFSKFFIPIKNLVGKFIFSRILSYCVRQRHQGDPMLWNKRHQNILQLNHSCSCIHRYDFDSSQQVSLNSSQHTEVLYY